MSAMGGIMSAQAAHAPVKPSRGNALARRKVAAALFAAVLAAGSWADHLALGQQIAQEPMGPAKDYDQRALEIYEFKKAARGGPDRGGEIFYYKCWFCHNEFTKDIPKLTGLYARPVLINGQPVNDDTVKNQIRNG